MRQVRGDAFLARVLDDGEHFERRDLTVADVSSTADWVRAAAAQNARKRREESADVKLSRMRRKVCNSFHRASGLSMPCLMWHPDLMELNSACYCIAGNHWQHTRRECKCVACGGCKGCRQPRILRWQVG